MFHCNEEDRQLVLLAMAESALLRPGFDDAYSQIADRMQGREVFEGFKKANRDRIKPHSFPREAPNEIPHTRESKERMEVASSSRKTQ